jgi:hypothetical protein
MLPAPRRPACTLACYAQFRIAHFDAALRKLEIRRTAPGPHATGLDNFVRAGRAVAAGEWLGEYLGELLPPRAPEGGAIA